MNRVLVAVDGATGSRACIDACVRLFAGRSPPAVTLLHVLRYGGPSSVDDLSSDAELAELRQALEGTPQLETLKSRAETALATQRAMFEKHGFRDLQTVIRNGRAAEGILNAAAEFSAELIVIGNTRSLLDKLMLGDVAHQVANGATIPVLLAR